MEGPERADSLAYLWDAFGRHGTFAAVGKPASITPEFCESGKTDSGSSFSISP